MNEKVRWYEKAPGNTSMMRISAMISMVAGTLVVLTGISLVIFIMLTGKESLSSLVGSLMTSGPIIMGVSQISKGIQANKENGA